MRTGLNRLAAACVPLTLLALSACGPEESDAKPSSDGKGASSTASSSPDATGDSAGEAGKEGQAQDEDAPAATGGQEENSSDWPEDDVAGDLPVDTAPIPEGAEGNDPDDAVVMTYDASAASEFSDAVTVGAASWNDRLSNVRLHPAKAGEKASIRIVVTNGWPLAKPGPAAVGGGTIEIGRRAVKEGHDTSRILAHEFGHILGLPDRRSEGCSSLMSGHAAGTSCENAYPDQYELGQVEKHFRPGN